MAESFKNRDLERYDDFNTIASMILDIIGNREGTLNMYEPGSISPCYSGTVSRSLLSNGNIKYQLEGIGSYQINFEWNKDTEEYFLPHGKTESKGMTELAQEVSKLKLRRGSMLCGTTESNRFISNGHSWVDYNSEEGLQIQLELGGKLI
jgi:hypothetical protein